MSKTSLQFVLFVISVLLVTVSSLGCFIASSNGETLLTIGFGITGILGAVQINLVVRLLIYHD